MHDNSDIEIIIEDETANTSKLSVTELMALYNETKHKDTADTSKLTNNITLKGLDEVKEDIAAALLQIEELSDKGKEQGFVGSTTSKAIALIDSNNKWIGKWFNGKVDALKVEAVKQKTVTEIIQNLRENIEAKREEVILLIEDLTSIRTNLLDRLEIYQNIDTQVTNIVKTATPSTRESFDAQQLAIMVKATTEKMQSDITSFIEPLIASATISVQQIQTLLPTIENDLQSKLSIKAFQQQLQDLNEMVKATTDMATSAGDKITQSVRQTIYDSIELLGNTGINTEALERNAKAEIEHQKKIKQVMDKASKKINDDFQNIQKIQNTLIENRTKTTSTLISQYSEKTNTGAR